MKLNERDRMMWVAGAVAAIAFGGWMLKRFLVWRAYRELDEGEINARKIRRWDRYSQGNGHHKKRRTPQPV